MGRRIAVVALGMAMVMSGTAGNASAAPEKSIRGEGVFAAYTPGAVAVDYDSTHVPVGAWAQMRGWTYGPQPKATTMVLTVRGLLPNHAYGAHVHMKPCGATADTSGSHYQNVPDPKQPSVDPQYANPRNEMWLDFTTDRNGVAYAETTVDWVPRAGQANAVVIHANHTSMEPGQSGTAGARLACLTVAF
ncbi:superoxide dismutase family protein [Kutzneria sp. NPDC052558]|uniref:superoxide dismutase family protein n=1 Tax=Kutzneria sp. NPDC052558 TaxID=3364121 RepID=UPI0037C7D2D5